MAGQKRQRPLPSKEAAEVLDKLKMNHTTSRHTNNDSGLVDQAEIVRSLAAIVAPDQVIEVRALNAKFSGDYRSGTISGYFEASNLEGLAVQTATITEAEGIYFVVNPCSPALLARAVNKLRRCEKSDPTTADHDILIRRYLLIDCDPTRPAKIASSDEEHDAALDRAARMSESLNEDGWPDPIFADSGNGGHLLYDINEACDDAGLIAAVLESLNNRFGDSAVKIDQTVFNPARIWKLYGTRACKGDPDAERIGRPHRMARILSVPDSRRVVTHGELIALVEKYGATQKSTKAESAGAKTETKGAAHSGDGNAWITEFIRRHNLKVSEPVPYKGGRKWVFEVCPFNSDHNDASAVITEAAGGGLGFKCHHNGCSKNDWHALRDLLEPDRRERSNGPAAAAGDDKRPPRPPPIIRTVRRLITGVSDDARSDHSRPAAAW
jgi:hypothetical protein